MNTVKEISFLETERNIMQKSANNAIVEWYANLSENLDPKYIDAAKGYGNVSAAVPVDAGKIHVDLPNSRTVVVDEHHTVKINVPVDPHPYMAEDDIYYKDPKAILILEPKFTITIDEDLKTAKITDVSYVEIKPDAIPTEVKKLEMRDKAICTIKELGERLSAYVGANDKDQKNAILEMFVEIEKNDKSAVSPKVETSHKYKNGNETINSKKNVEMYLNRLKGDELTFADYKMMDERMIKDLKAENPDKFESDIDFDSNLYAVMFLVNQRYESRNYTDNTKKVVFLKYHDSGKYLIEKIKVVPNSTILQ